MGRAVKYSVLPRNEKIQQQADVGLAFEPVAARAIAYRREPWSGVKKSVTKDWTSDLNATTTITLQPTQQPSVSSPVSQASSGLSGLATISVSIITDFRYEYPYIQVKRREVNIVAVSYDDESDWETVHETGPCDA